MAVKDKPTKLEAQEARVPELAIKAWKAAFARARKGSQPVLIIRDGKLIELNADGSEHVVRKVAHSIKVTRGKKLSLK